MLNGLYIIDGVDIWQTYSAAILKDSYNSLLVYPDRKVPDIDDWFEEDYIDVDYSNPCFESIDITLKIGIYGNSRNDLLLKVDSFKNFLNKEGSRDFNISGINTTIKLRYKGGEGGVGSPLLNGNQFYLEQNLLFSNDSPLSLFKEISVFDYTFDYTFRGLSKTFDPIPYEYMVWNNFNINGTPVTDYGMGVTSFNGSALTFDTLKEPLINKYSNKSGGSVLVGSPLKSQQKILNIGIVMAHEDISYLMNNYNSLFNTLSENTPVNIFSQALDSTFYGYYSKQTNFSININGKIKIIEFNLELIITYVEK